MCIILQRKQKNQGLRVNKVLILAVTYNRALNKIMLSLNFLIWETTD